MDLVNGAKKVICVMTHDAKGSPKVMKENTYPLTGRGVVDVLITDKALFRWYDGNMVLEELAPGITLEEVRSTTEAEFTYADKIKEFDINIDV